MVGDNGGADGSPVPVPGRVASRWANAAPSLRVSHVNHFYGQKETAKQVLFENNLVVRPGELVILTGPSGSGKTTLLTLIGALRSVQDGSVIVLGRELNGMSRAELGAVRRGIGFIFQAHNLFDSLTAMQNVRMALELEDHTPAAMRQRATELLEALGLGHRLHFKPRSLSGGQRQRVAIARALANRPKLILADEPTAALDKKSSHDVVALLQRLADEEGCTILMVTHDSRILDVADRIVNMIDGRIVSDVRVHETVTVCAFLKACPAFAGLTPSDLTDVAQKMTSQSVAAGDAVVREGEPGETFYLIRHGTFDVLRRKDGRPERVDGMGTGEFFGEAALLTGQPRNATVVAASDGELLTLTREQFHAAIERAASFKDQLLTVFAQRDALRE